jgi:predicted HTH transcriptional regulator
MTPEELRALMLADEDNFVERKTTGQRDEVIKTLVAFANSVPEGREAVLFVGVSPDLRVSGVENPDSLQPSIRQWARDICYPPIDFRSEVLRDFDEGSALAVIVPASAQRPHFRAATIRHRRSMVRPMR